MLPPGPDPGEQLDTLVDRPHRPDGELTVLHGLEHVMIQHEVPNVRPGDHHPLTPRQPRDPAIVEEALDLLVDAPDRLDVAELVHGARDGDPLVQGKPRKSLFFFL